MNFKRMFVLLPLLTLPALAAAPKVTFEGNFSLVLPQGDLLNAMTDNGGLGGYTLGVAARIETAPDLSFRFHVNELSFHGIDGSGLEKGGPRHLFGGVDICQVNGKLTYFGGLGFIKWKQDEATATLNNYKIVTSPYSDNRTRGTKFLGRIGAEYAFTDKLHGVASFTQTEFNRKLNPSWVSLGITYTFGGL